MNYDTAVLARTEAIRNFINLPRRQHAIFQNREKWLQLCSSLDTVEDTEFAIYAFVHRMFSNKIEAYYLAIYGLLQALFVQQDAVAHLADALGVRFVPWEDPCLSEIRDLRNRSIGHPSRKDRPATAPVSFHFMTRMRLSPEQFEVQSTDAQDGPIWEMLSTSTLIEQQRASLTDALATVLARLEEEDLAYRRQFRMTKLVDVFHESTYYLLNKISGSLIGVDPLRTGMAALQSIKAACATFRDELSRRSSVDMENLAMDYAVLEFAIAEVERILQNLIESTGDPLYVPETPSRLLSADQKTAYIFSLYLEAQVRKLQTWAKEIDEDYAE